MDNLYKDNTTPRILDGEVKRFVRTSISLADLFADELKLERELGLLDDIPRASDAKTRAPLKKHVFKQGQSYQIKNNSRDVFSGVFQRTVKGFERHRHHIFCADGCDYLTSYTDAQLVGCEVEDV